MRKLKNLIAGVAIVAVCSCEKRTNENNISAQDKNFVRQVISFNRSQIILGNIATSKSADDSVRSYAQLMVAKHNAAEAGIKEIASALDISVATDSLGDASADLRVRLNSASGRKFDSIYIKSEVAAHNKANENFTAQTDGGTSKILRNFSKSALNENKSYRQLAYTLAKRYK